MASVAKRRSLNAVVVSAGLMQKTVKVRIGTTNWNAHIRKHFKSPKDLLVHDPRSSLRLGDVIAIESGWRVTKNVRHVVSKIIAPYGEPIEARPAVLTYEERVAEKEQRRAEKKARKEARKEEKDLGKETSRLLERMMARKLGGDIDADIEDDLEEGDMEGFMAIKEAKEAEVS